MPPPGLPTAVRTGSLADFVTHLPLRLCIASSILSFGPGAIYATCPSSLLPPYPIHFYYFFTYTCTVYRSAYVSFPPLRTLSTPQSTYLIVFAPLGRPIPPVRHPAIPCSASPRIVDLFERLGSAAISGILVLAAFALCPSYDYSIIGTLCYPCFFGPRPRHFRRQVTSVFPVHAQQNLSVSIN